MILGQKKEKLKSSFFLFVCFFTSLFVYLFVCTSRLAIFAKANGPNMRKYAFDERIDGIFALAESLPTPATRIWAYLELTRSF